VSRITRLPAAALPLLLLLPSFVTLGWAESALAAPPSAPPTLGSDPRLDPTAFTVTIFASDLPYPMSMQQLADSSLLVLTNVPNAGGSLLDSTGELLRLVDANQDGVADGPGSVLYAGLAGVATSMRQQGDLLFVSSRETGSERITILRAGSTPASEYTLLGSIDFTFPFGSHRNVALGVRDTPGMPGSVDLFFNVGSAANFAQTLDTFSAGGLMPGVPGADSMTADSIWKVQDADTGGTPSLSNLVKIGAGLRNAAGIDFDPATGDLYFEDNGIDGLTNSQEPHSADELNRIPLADIGGAVEDFGFPSDYIEYRTGNIIGGTQIQPLVAFIPIPDPATGAESEGPVEIAFAPPLFPASLRDGIFVAFHGQFNSGGAANEENPLVWTDPLTGDYFHFITNTEVEIGHLDGLLATDDSLFMSDMNMTGSVFSSQELGVIYQVRANPAAVPLFDSRGFLGLLVAISCAAMIGLRRRSIVR
jgi:glucose/arabinose dehydrogenase